MSRCFLIPHSSAIVAGGTVAPDATLFTLQAKAGVHTYGILSNKWLEQNARTVRYEVTIDTSVDGEFTYTETSVIHHAKMPDAVTQTDRNTLKRIADD